MDLAIIVAVVGAAALGLLFVLARRALKLFVRLLLAGVLILLMIAGGLVWWWYGSGSSTGSRGQGNSNTRRANSR